MTIQEIQNAVSEGKIVHWSNVGYMVIKDDLGQFLIKCTRNNHCIGLTNIDGDKLNGKPEDFFINKEEGRFFYREVSF